MHTHAHTHTLTCRSSVSTVAMIGWHTRPSNVQEQGWIGGLRRWLAVRRENEGDENFNGQKKKKPKNKGEKTKTKNLEVRGLGLGLGFFIEPAQVCFENAHVMLSTSGQGLRLVMMI